MGIMITWLAFQPLGGCLGLSIHVIIIPISVLLLVALPPSYWKASLEFASSIFQELLGGRVHGRGSECRPWNQLLGLVLLFTACLL